LTIDDCITQVAKAYWERILDEKPILVVTGTSGKWDPVCVVSMIKDAIQKGVTTIYVNPHFKNTPIYLDVYVPLKKEGWVVPLDGEEFLLTFLLSNGVQSSDIFPKEGL
jgi:NAD-dependent SIR2 family protein deacetylase